MSVQAALDFIQYLRKDQSENSTPIIDPLTTTLHDVTMMGAQRGYLFSEDDLRAAFRHDWHMRWLRFGVSKTSATEAGTVKVGTV